MLRRLLCGLMGMIALAQLPALGREKTDVIILKNGDHVTGEIKSLTQGMLTLKTDSMGTVEIKWEDIERVTSPYRFRLGDTNGQLYYGTLKPAAEAKIMEVVSPESTSRVDHLSIVRIDEFDKRLWDRFSGSFGLGFSYTKASTVTQFNLNGDITYRGSNWEGTATYSSIINRSEGTTQANTRTTTLIARHYLGRRWFAFSSANFQHNSGLDLDLRSQFVEGLGRTLRQTNRQDWKLGGGVSYAREDYANTEGTNNAEAVIGTNYQIFKLYTPKVNVQVSFQIIPSLSQLGRLRSELNTGLNFEIFKDFFWNMSFYDSYDNSPPKATATKNDYGFVTGLNWTFRK